MTRKPLKLITCEICGEQFPREEVCYASLIDYPTFGDAIVCNGCLDVFADGLSGARGFYIRSLMLGQPLGPIMEEMTEQNMWDILLYGDNSWASRKRDTVEVCFYYTEFPEWLDLARDEPGGEIDELEICPGCGLLFFSRCDYDDCKDCPLEGRCTRGGFPRDSCRNCGASNPYHALSVRADMWIYGTKKKIGKFFKSIRNSEVIR